MKVLIVGRAGREHSIARALAREPAVEVFCAPGNAGMRGVAQCLAIDEQNGPALAAWCRHTGTELAVIGPAEPLAAGLWNALRAVTGLVVVGPSRRGAMLEVSKRYTRLMCQRLNVPSPKFKVFASLDEAVAAVALRQGHAVLKLDGLHGGKGTFVASDQKEALGWLSALRGNPAVSGYPILLEEFLTGEELSFTAAIDGDHILPLARARDYKRCMDGDIGPNTGGMGSWSGPCVGSSVSDDEIVERIFNPIVGRLQALGIRYHGFLYAGLMLTDDGPKLLEFNVRLGDSEAQSMLARLRSPLSVLLLAIGQGDLRSMTTLRWSDDFAVTVTLARRGYPTATGFSPVPIEVPAAIDDDLQVSFASVQIRDDRLHATGGRVLHVTAKAPSLSEAAVRALDFIGRIRCEDSFYRHDIGM